MAVYICDNLGVKSYYPNVDTKTIVDILIESGVTSFLVRFLYDETTIEKVSTRALKSDSIDNVIMGYSKSFESTIKVSDPEGRKSLMKINGNNIRYYLKEKAHFLRSRNFEDYRSSGITVFTTETLDDVIREYAKGDNNYTVYDGEFEFRNGGIEKVYKPITEQEFLRMTKANINSK